MVSTTLPPPHPLTLFRSHPPPPPSSHPSLPCACSEGYLSQKLGRSRPPPLPVVFSAQDLSLVPKSRPWYSVGIPVQDVFLLLLLSFLMRDLPPICGLFPEALFGFPPLCFFFPSDIFCLGFVYSYLPSRVLWQIRDFPNLRDFPLPGLLPKLSDYPRTPLCR